MNKKKRFAAFAAAFIIIISAQLSPFAPTATALSPDGTEVITVSKTGSVTLLPGGMPFGVKFYTDGVMLVGFCDIQTENGSVNPASDAGLRIRDVIVAVDGETLNGAAQLTAKIENSGGRPLSLTFHRDGKEGTVTLTPVYSSSEGRYKTGILVRDSGAGIGTVTFIVPSSGAFAGLGHGICDSESGEIIPMQRGSVSGVTISGLERGVAGDPGEVKGYFNPGKCGTLLGNTENGVYGIFTDLPDFPPEDALPVGTRSQIHDGKAYIWCTLDTNKPCKYTVELSSIDRSSESNKCFTVTVTDKALLTLSGGIIQGMSGSPIIQDGRIVGAVTHVLINDPTRGYGIFIENMLASMPELLS